MRVFISAGEASGDAYGAALVTELRTVLANSDLEMEAVGGRLIGAMGVRLVADASKWGAVGIQEAIRVGPLVVSGFRRAKQAILTGRPGLFIPIDFGFFNIRLCRIAKAAGWKVLYFIPPGSWRKTRQGRDLPTLTDAVSTPFPWSAEILNRMGARARWYGHPIRQLVREGLSNDPDAPRDEALAIMPGSRQKELRMNLPLMASALSGRTERLDFVVAPTVDATELSTWWNRLAPGRHDRFVTTDKYGVLLHAKAAVVCSGTATLDAALCDCPMVVVYRVSKVDHFQGFLMGLKRQLVSLPNIFLDREVVPELVGYNVQSSEVAAKLDEVLANVDIQRTAFAELKTILGPEDAIARTAELAVEIAGRMR